VTVAIGQGVSGAPDGVLVQEAAAGSGVSYGALYDRYADQVYNYCLRVTGSEEDAADATQEAFLNVLRRLQADDRPVVEFSSYLFAAARNESYSLMRRRARVQPSETPPEERDRLADLETEPERAVLLQESQEAVREANAQLAPRHREVLALRELGGRSYGEIGRIMGISENGAAQLIWRARAKLREAMTAGAVASVVATSADCERAQLLLSSIQDGEPVEQVDRAWLEEHLDECGSCRAAEGMLYEVAASYRCWLPVAALPLVMRGDTLAAAGQIVGADWSGVASAAHGAGAGAGGGGGGGGTAGGTATAGGTGAAGGTSGVVAAAAGVATLAAVGIALSAVINDDSGIDPRLTEPVQQPAVSAPAPKKSKGGAPAKHPKASPIASEITATADEPLRVLRKPPGPAAETDTPTSGAPESGPQPQPGDPPRTEEPTFGTPPSPDPNRGPPADTSPPSDQPVIPPPVDTSPPEQPPPPEPSECTWPGRGGGPTGCPPGHGGTPPGQGGTPPGQGKKPK
jgi:RNA polymerase sigma factor (sigma-70 family)